MAKLLACFTQLREMVSKLGKDLCSMFLFAVLQVDPAQNLISCM